MTKSSMNLSARFLFQDRGIVPTKKLLLGLIILSFCLMIASLLGATWTFIIICNVVVLLGSFIDLIFSPGKNYLRFSRFIPNEMERGLDYTVNIKVENLSKHPLDFRLVDGLPQSFVRPFPLQGKIIDYASVTISYQTFAPVRGRYELEKLYFRYTSRWGLWEKQTTALVKDQVKVIPDLTMTKEYLESPQKFLLHEGMKIRKYKSGFGEFAKVRSYVIGDDPRKINWRQSAKLQEVMTNEYEPEHGKYITILIDCGRMMGAELKIGNRLEKALEAALTVTAAALQNGDYVAVIAFSKKVKVYIPPAKGQAHLKTILNAIYNLEVEAAESNYEAILNYLEMVQKKRSLLLLFSDVGTFLYEESTLNFLKQLKKRHLFLMIGIKDQSLIQKTNNKPVDIQAAMEKSVAQQQLIIKKRKKIKWEKQGLQMIETEAERLASTAVSSYINMINQGLL